MTNCIPAGEVNPADSYWVEIKMAINGNNTVRPPYQKLIVSQANFYNLNGTLQEYCNKFNYDLFYILPLIEIDYLNGATTGCNALTRTLYIDSKHGYNVDITPNEFRPLYNLDSIIIPIPQGYVVNQNNPANVGITRSRRYLPNNLSGYTTFTHPSNYTIVNNNLVLNLNNSPAEFTGAASSGPITFQFSLLPTCATPPSVNAQDNRNIELYLKEFVYVPLVKVLI